MKHKVQSEKCKVKVQSLKLLVLSFGFALFAFSFTLTCYAQEITILYTGETHAMLYPCNCPIDPDGGVARRATLIKQLRQNNPNTLVLDSGGFFAGGLQDEYTQNVTLDMQRALVNLKAMELMQYDALAIGDDEFNFGREFLEENIMKTNLAFLSCNISDTSRNPALFRPYIIKEVGGKKIGIIGVTGLLAMQKASGLKFIEPRLAVKQAVSELKKNNTDIIILLSHLGESEDLNLIKDVEDIDILIVGHSRAKEEPFTKMGRTLILRPAWQGRRLGEMTLITVKDNQIADYKVEDLRLSDKITNDPGILAILPRCFSDNNCKQEGMIGICQGSGTLKSQCVFSEASKVPLLIITTKLCNVCNTERIDKYLKTLFPGLVTSYLYYPESLAAKLISDFGIKALPAYLLGKEAEREKDFDKLKENLEIKGNFYMLKPNFSGIAYFLERKSIKGRLDLFISLYDKNTPALLDMIKEFNPVVHFLAVEKAKGNFETQGGNLEVEEYLRSVCVQKYYPANFWDYISCRGKFINTSWWQDCLNKLDTNKISMCARSDEGKELLRENISLNKELQIIFGSAYLVDNQEIFASQGVPKKEEFKKIIKR
ncbi:MAG: metallophosphatase [Candidatus Omnitrophota bacterium]|nr:metallophosphatase [Candidatus Omnitrophota bacterium]